MSQEFSSESIEITTLALGCSKEMAIEVLRETERQKKIVLGQFVNKIKKRIDGESTHRVIDGRAPKELREAFKEGEEIGRESMRELSLKIISESTALTENLGEKEK